MNKSALLEKYTLIEDIRIHELTIAGLKRKLAQLERDEAAFLCGLTQAKALLTDDLHPYLHASEDNPEQPELRLPEAVPITIMFTMNMRNAETKQFSAYRISQYAVGGYAYAHLSEAIVKAAALFATPKTLSIAAD